MRKLKYIGLLIILSCVNLFAQAIVYINPQTINITNDTTAIVEIKIAGVTDLKTYRVSLSFNDSIVEFSEVTRKEFLRSGGASGSTFLTQPSTLNIINNFSVDETLKPEFSGGILTASGSGTLFSVEFDILEAGFTEISIDEVKLYDLSGQYMSVEFYSGSITVMLPVKAKVFFEGPFSVDKMNTVLNQNGHLPNSQPYSVSPWNYSGSESVPLNFFASNPNIVDWVLLELRTGILPSTRVAEQACFVLNDGSLVGLDGSAAPYFEQATNDYYIVITHRNHLSIMNALPYPISKTSAEYDFTDSQSKAYGSGAMTEVATGVFAMYAADANSDGNITGTDFNIFNPDFRSAASGYLNTDFNLDGSVTGTDFNLFNPNFRSARSSNVPK
ncbi:MAG: hypothetical protein HND52_16285 [Ignavibacteriae bacterium]|nr:hypothetical protein [Ignavibacteriota bacterium]NOG99516.1 hypothetical protein [Ignavibacteriota bacterium]